MTKYFSRVFIQKLNHHSYNLKYNLVCLRYLIFNSIFDTYRYARFSSSFRTKRSQGNQRAWLSLYYHKIEKGLALPHPRFGFGADWIVPAFLPLLEEYSKQHGCDTIVESSQAALRAYLEYNSNDSSSAQTKITIEAIMSTFDKLGVPSQSVGGGIKPFISDSLKEEWNMDFARFAYARHSIRSFSEEIVDKLLIERAVEIAQQSPSVCNRQPWLVHALTNEAKIREALQYQNGNIGFGESIKCLLLITGDNSAMLWHYERNEIWVDGGLFSMTLGYAFQSLGLGTCMLNLSLPYNKEKILAALYKLPLNERPIMMMAVGHLPERLNVAYSQRHPLSSVLVWDD